MERPSVAAAGYRATLLALLCAGCTTIAPGTGTFEGTRWRVANINGQDTPATDNYRMEFTHNRVSARFGCNSFSGTYRVSPYQIDVSDLVGTRMACSPPAGTFENMASAIMREPMHVRPNGRDSLVLMSGPGAIVLRRLP
jgi:heat shock protein HslJ